MTSIQLPVSIGEALDKLSILDIKLRHISDNRKNDVQHEYDLLYKHLKQYIEPHKFYYQKMIETNELIWNDQDILRDNRETPLSNEEYTTLCKRILDTNDMRFRIKNKINNLVNSNIREQKGYAVKKGLFVGHMGLGDVINLISAIRYYSIVYDELYIIVKEQYKSNIYAFIGNDPSIHYLDASYIHPNGFESQLSYESIKEFAKINNCTPLICGQYLTNSHSFNEVPYNFYRDLGLPDNYYQKYFYLPTYREQQELLDMILTQTKRIVFTHLTASNLSIKYSKDFDPDVFYCNPCVSNYKPGERFYELSQKMLNHPIIAYTKIIEAAEEIYVIDSVFACLSAQLNTAKAGTNKYMFVRTIIFNFNNKPQISYTFGKDTWKDFTIEPIFA
jgi:hypothetical protein